jgi:DNA-binding transcriptional MocR family regulator
VDVIELARNSPVPLGDQLVDGLAAQIEGRRLAEGTRLPSVRQLAKQLGVGVFTVVGAYDRLVARGLIEARQGSGFFVAARANLPAPVAIEQAGPPDTVLGLAQQALEVDRVTVPAGSGFLPPAWLAEAVTPTVMARVAKHAHSLFRPTPPQGEPGLRELLADRLRLKGINAASGQILITFGASQAFDLLARALLVPGDAVLVEDPGYFVLFAQLARHGLRLLPVPRQADGPDLEAVETLCRLHRPRLMFTQTLLHNPTGSNTSPAKCHRLLGLAEKHGLLIVEDDVYGDFAPDQALRLAQIDEFEHVIHVGGFSKALGPGLRVGFVAAAPAIIRQLMEQKILSVLSGALLPELVVAEVLRSGRFRRHAEQLRRRLAKTHGMARKALAAAGVMFDEQAGAGLFLWGRVPEGIDVGVLVRTAREHGILLAAGRLFSPAGGCQTHLRFNVVHATDPALSAFLRPRLAA